MMKSLFGIAVLALTVTAASENANGAKFAPFTGDDYLTECTTTPQNTVEHIMAAYCTGYIEAAVSFVTLMNGQSFCMPLDTAAQDVIDVAVAFIRTRPDHKQYMSASVILTAVEAKWPCRSK
jgi:hypothetical protein